MPRFYFHFREGDITTPDVEGEVVSDLDEAWNHGVEVAKGLIDQLAVEGQAVGDRQRVEICDENGEARGVISLVEVARSTASRSV